MNWLAVTLHGLHVLLAVVWLGGHVVRVLLVEPAVRTLSDAARAQIQAEIDRRATRLFVPVIVGVAVTGVLRGTVAGPIQSIDALVGSPYGWTFAVSIAFGLVAFFPRKPEWLLWVALFGAFTAMVLMHFGL